MEILINQDLKRYIRPLSDTEYEGLESSCISDGIRDPLVIAVLPDTKVLADGHNRYDIAKKHGIEFNTVEKYFDSIKEVKAWMLVNQLSKRNLTKEEESYYRGLRYRLEKEDIGGDRGNQYTKVAGGHNVPLPKTSGKIGDELGVTGRTIKRDSNYSDAIDKIAAIAGEDVKNEILSRSIKSSKKDITELAKLNPEEIEKVINDIKEKPSTLKDFQKGVARMKAQSKLENEAKKEITTEEKELLTKAINGETVVININKHFSVLKWAKDNNKYQQIDRFSEWGNPFFLPADGNRDEVCDAYELHYIPFKKGLTPKIKELKGKVLGCHCAPLRCHGHSLKKLADANK